MVKPPLNVCIMPENLLTALEPEGHLWKLVLAICCSVGVLRKIDVQALHVLSVVIVGGTEKLDGDRVVIE